MTRRSKAGLQRFVSVTGNLRSNNDYRLSNLDCAAVSVTGSLRSNNDSAYIEQIPTWLQLLAICRVTMTMHIF